MKKCIIACGLILPLFAYALDFSGTHLPYKDVREGTPEAAAISLLTAENVVRGYSDGTFRPNQTLNRAEFLKIVIASHPDLWTSVEDFADCFPDVTITDWFSRYVCFAKNRGVVGGYPDGTFKPANNVNYAEALKMLAGLYNYPLDAQEGDEWYKPFARAALAKGTSLPSTIPYSDLLTRGEMARLAAAFLSESQGLLATYRLAERGKYTSSSESSVESSSASGVSERSSSSSSSSVSQTTVSLPATSSFMIVGQISKPLADVVFVMQNEQTRITQAEVRLFQEVPTLDTLDIVTADGNLIATLKRRTVSNVDDYRRRYEVAMNTGEGYVFAANASVPIFVRAKLRDEGNYGASNQLLQVQQISVTTYGLTSGTTFSFLNTGPFPSHQSSFGRIAKTANAGPANGTLMSGANQEITRVSFSGSVISGKSLSLTQLVFSLHKSGDLTVANWKLASDDGGVSMSCSTGSEGISCSSIPSSLGLLDTKKILVLHADISFDASAENLSLQANLEAAGSPSLSGGVRWADGTGDFKWIESAEPVVEGTLWRK